MKEQIITMADLIYALKQIQNKQGKEPAYFVIYADGSGITGIGHPSVPSPLQLFNDVTGLSVEEGTLSGGSESEFGKLLIGLTKALDAVKNQL